MTPQDTRSARVSDPAAMPARSARVSDPAAMPARSARVSDPAAMPNQPNPGTTAAGGASLAVLVIAVVLLVLAAGAVVVVPPRFAKIFADFETELPILTNLALSVPGYVQGLGLLAVAAALVAKELLLHDNTIKLVMNLAGLLLALAFGAFLVVALFLPLNDIFMKLS